MKKLIITILAIAIAAQMVACAPVSKAPVEEAQKPVVEEPKGQEENTSDSQAEEEQELEQVTDEEIPSEEENAPASKEPIPMELSVIGDVTVTMAGAEVGLGIHTDMVSTFDPATETATVSGTMNMTSPMEMDFQLNKYYEGGYTYDNTMGTKAKTADVFETYTMDMLNTTAFGGMTVADMEQLPVVSQEGEITFYEKHLTDEEAADLFKTQSQMGGDINVAGNNLKYLMGISNGEIQAVKTTGSVDIESADGVSTMAYDMTIRVLNAGDSVTVTAFENLDEYENMD